jgi:hypothetical protein
VAGSIFVRREIEGVSGLAYLRGRRVPVHAGSLGEQLLIAGGLASNVFHVPSVDRAFQLLERGEGDATPSSRLIHEVG